MALIAAELSGDGLIDLAVAGGEVRVLLNYDDGVFATAVPYPVGTMPTTLDAVELDADGDLHLLTANRESNDVSVLLNDGAGSFGTATQTAVGDSPRAVVIGDLEGDGVPDALVWNYSPHRLVARALSAATEASDAFRELGREEPGGTLDAMSALSTLVENRVRSRPGCRHVCSLPGTSAAARARERPGSEPITGPRAGCHQLGAPSRIVKPF